MPSSPNDASVTALAAAEGGAAKKGTTSTMGTSSYYYPFRVCCYCSSGCSYTYGEPRCWQVVGGAGGWTAMRRYPPTCLPARPSTRLAAWAASSAPPPLHATTLVTSLLPPTPPSRLPLQCTMGT